VLCKLAKDSKNILLADHDIAIRVNVRRSGNQDRTLDIDSKGGKQR